MNYVPDKSSIQPAYLQLYHLLRADIAAGVYPSGSRLPSKRVIADETGLSIVTVEHAISLLQEEGYVEPRPRSGNFVIFRADGVSHPKTLPSPSIQEPNSLLQPLQKGDFPFSVMAKTMRKVLLDYGERILVRSPNRGCPELRSEIAAYLARSRGIRVIPERIVVGSGAEYLYGLIAQLLPHGTLFALEDPGYGKIRSVYESLGVPCEMLPLNPDGIDSAALKKTPASVLHTTPFNSFPSGISIGAVKKHEYLRWAADRGGLIVEDNYDSELTVSGKPEDTLFGLDDGKRVIYLNTFSRTVAPSLRVGYMVLPEQMASLFDEKLGFYSCTVPVFTQYVLTELIKNGDYERHINRERRKKRRAAQTKAE